MCRASCWCMQMLLLSGRTACLRMRLPPSRAAASPRRHRGTHKRAHQRHHPRPGRGTRCSAASAPARPAAGSSCRGCRRSSALRCARAGSARMFLETFIQIYKGFSATFGIPNAGMVAGGRFKYAGLLHALRDGKYPPAEALLTPVARTVALRSIAASPRRPCSAIRSTGPPATPAHTTVTRPRHVAYKAMRRPARLGAVRVRPHRLLCARAQSAGRSIGRRRRAGDAPARLGGQVQA